MKKKTLQALALLVLFSILIALPALRGAVFAAGPDPGETTETTAATLSETTETAPETTEAAPETTEAAPETTEAAPETTEAAPETTEAAPETTEAAPTEETAEPTAPSWVKTASDEELMEAFSIPDNWAKNALLFAVRNELLFGKEDGAIHEKDTATRAELAAILTRILPSAGRNDLSGYEDVQADAWYYDSLSAASALGFFSGTSATTMLPGGLLTREQTFSVIARAFGLAPGVRRDLFGFADWTEAGTWAIPQVAAVVNAGYIVGSNGRVRPQGQLTRAELAQVLYSVIQQITPLPREDTVGLTVVQGGALPKGFRADGDVLLLSDADAVALEAVTVTGRLILQGCGRTNLSLAGSAVGELVLCRPATVTDAEGVQKITVRKGVSVLHGSVKAAEIYDSTTLVGDVKTVLLRGGSLTVGSIGSVQTCEAAYTAAGETVTVNGRIEELTVRAKNMTVGGRGSLGKVTVEKRGCKLVCPSDTRVDSLDAGISALELERTDTTVPSKDAPQADLAFAVSGARGKDCDVVWFLDGDYVGAVGKPLDLSLILSANFASHLLRPKCSLRITVYYEDQKRDFNFEIDVKSDVYALALRVQSAYVKATVRYSCGLYRSPGSGLVQNVEAGTVVTYEAYRGTSYAQILLPNGNRGWVNWYAISISNANPTVSWDYAPEVKECWVNDVKGYSSPTGYLVWCNLYTQKVNIFQGSKGNWKLIRTFPCATGRNQTPTLRQVTKIQYKTYQWNWPAYYVRWVSVVDSGGRAFHSILYTHQDEIYDATMGRPVSHGCMRMWLSDCKYIYDTVPTGTTVVIY